MAKIVFLGNFNVDFTTETHHAKSLESLGHTVIRLQEGTATGNQVMVQARNADLFVWVHTHKWTTGGTMNMKMVLKELRRIGVPSISYHLDLWFGLRRQIDLERSPVYQDIEYFFTVDKLMADWFNEKTRVKGVFLPAAVFGEEAYIHSDYDKQRFDHDVIFVGSKAYHPEWQYRPKLINFLKETYGKRFTHVGPDGDTGGLRGDKLNEMYVRSKIAVGDTLNIDFKYPHYSSDRLFESTGRGAFTIYPRIEGITDWYEDGKEIVYYEHGNLDDLKEKINYYLVHDEEREAIRLAGHERAKTEHTYVHRWQTILDKLGIN
jgi:glycosyltransferase involved in cell wall biosynthesis